MNNTGAEFPNKMSAGKMWDTENICKPCSHCDLQYIWKMLKNELNCTTHCIGIARRQFSPNCLRHEATTRYLPTTWMGPAMNREWVTSPCARSHTRTHRPLPSGWGSDPASGSEKMHAGGDCVGVKAITTERQQNPVEHTHTLTHKPMD